MMRNKEVLRLMDKVRVEGAKTEDLTGAGLFAAPAKVTIETVDGSIFSRTVVAVKGSPQLPLSAIEWDEKFDNCVVPSLGSKQAKELKESLARLETINRIGELTKMMAAKET